MAGGMVRRTRTAESLANVRRTDTQSKNGRCCLNYGPWRLAMAMAVDNMFVADSYNGGCGCVCGWRWRPSSFTTSLQAARN